MISCSPTPASRSRAFNRSTAPFLRSSLTDTPLSSSSSCSSSFSCLTRHSGKADRLERRRHVELLPSEGCYRRYLTLFATTNNQSQLIHAGCHGPVTAQAAVYLVQLAQQEAGDQARTVRIYTSIGLHFNGSAAFRSFARHLYRSLDSSASIESVGIFAPPPQHFPYSLGGDHSSAVASTSAPQCRFADLADSGSALACRPITKMNDWRGAVIVHELQILEQRRLRKSLKQGGNHAPRLPTVNKTYMVAQELYAVYAARHDAHWGCRGLHMSAMPPKHDCTHLCSGFDIVEPYLAHMLHDLWRGRGRLIGDGDVRPERRDAGGARELDKLDMPNDVRQLGVAPPEQAVPVAQISNKLRPTQKTRSAQRNGLDRVARLRSIAHGA